jgi:predicted membrane-bound mannosyltransferase
VWHARSRFAVFAALWAGGIIAAYSLIPYKTPWLTLNFIIPLAITGGYGVDLMYRRAAGDQGAPALVLAVLAAALIFCGYQMVQLNFRHYDDEQYVYPYAHTVREILPLVEQVNRFAAGTGMGKQITISITSPDYWPLPWYLKDYKHVGYSGRIAVSDERLVIGSEAQELELQTLLGERYRRIDAYQLRPGVTLVLYARRDPVKP